MNLHKDTFPKETFKYFSSDHSIHGGRARLRQLLCQAGNKADIMVVIMAVVKNNCPFLAFK